MAILHAGWLIYGECFLGDRKAFSGYDFSLCSYEHSFFGYKT